MSERVHEKPMIDAPIARRVDETADDVPREERARLSGYKRRFALIYLGLALAAGVGLGALVVVLSDTDHTTQVVAQAWSEFHPGRLAERARERDRSARHEPLPGLGRAAAGRGASPGRRSSSRTSRREAPRS